MAGPGLVHRSSDSKGMAGSSSLVAGCTQMAGNVMVQTFPAHKDSMAWKLLFQATRLNGVRQIWI